MTDLVAAQWMAVPVHEREQFERDGYLILRGVLTPAEVARYTEAVDREYERARLAGDLAADGSYHRLSAVTTVPDLVDLVDHPRAFAWVWSLLGWNVHIYHSHLDIHPGLRVPKPAWWHWHQDGGRMNRELETDPRPRMSVKLAFWLSDVSAAGRGNLTLIPGSHRVNWLPGPPRRDIPWPQPVDALQVRVNAGDVVLFDRRIWHARSDNHSPVTRKVVFLGYTYRWIAIRDCVAHLPHEEWWDRLTPVQQQLLGASGGGDGDHLWGHYPERTPLYGELRTRGLLDPGYPPLIP
ncbi:MAG TPA: phytanoyl-CoA dioxygenase family protein [Rugosimonospora sp.]|nr:phytanoyl-CoA dioxygenase family protein [Rugosimonospora sp.]